MHTFTVSEAEVGKTVYGFIKCLNDEQKFVIPVEQCLILLDGKVVSHNELNHTTLSLGQRIEVYVLASGG